jgi:prenyltransferase beta subunit
MFCLKALNTNEATSSVQNSNRHKTVFRVLPQHVRLKHLLSTYKATHALLRVKKKHNISIHGRENLKSYLNPLTDRDKRNQDSSGIYDEDERQWQFVVQSVFP